jgi:myo-inositol-1(or 4)-monophosphatase
MRPLVNAVTKIARQSASLLVRSYDQLPGVIEQSQQAEVGARLREQLFEEMCELIKEAQSDRIVQLVEKPIDSALPVVWVVDPVVGIENFLHQNPDFLVAISIYEQGKPVVAVVYDALRHDVYTVAAGQGAQLNGRKLTISPHAKLEGASLATCIPTQSPECTAQWVASLPAMADVAQSVSTSTLPLLTMCRVAASQMDAFYAVSLSPSMLHFGLFFLKEARALLTDFNGAEVFEQGGSLVAANPKLLRALLSVVR